MDPELFEYLCTFLTEERLATFERVLNLRTRHITVAFDNLYKQHNISACLRSCDCFGIQDVHVIESRNPFEPNREIALGAMNWLTTIRHRDEYSGSNDCLRHLREAGYRIVATSPLAEFGSVRDLDISEKTAILFGNEKVGLSDELFEAADECVRIPMSGFTESFNISVAVAITLYEFTERIRQQTDDWVLSPEEKQVLREDWVRKTIGWKLQSYIRRFEQDRRLDTSTDDPSGT